jgi:hypothetical protein
MTSYVQLYFTGYVGGGLYSATGSAANSVCLPRDPTWGKYDDTVQTSYTSTIYGAEFNTGLSRDESVMGQDLMDHDIQCAVCRSESHTSSVMIPARTSCYHDWTIAYSGYLMAGDPVHHGTEYLCMDAHPEPEPHSHQDDNGHLFQFVEGRCGSLPCLPYVNGRELACVVCTK